MSEKAAKYGNVKTVIDGIKFDSRKEATFYGKLKLMKRAGEILDFEMQPKFEYNISYTAGNPLPRLDIKRKYIADFKVIFPDGRTEIWDVKGVKTAIYKQKKKIIEKLYGIEIIEK